MKNLPHLNFEKELWQQDYLVIGVDEVGRGALAGPVGVGAVCLKPLHPDKCKELECLGINDSKKLTKKQREFYNTCLPHHILASAVTFSEVDVINKEGIVKAVNKAIRVAVSQIQEQLKHHKKPFYLLLDAFEVKRVVGIGLRHQKAIIRGDSTSISIASAAILAKVKRDAVMDEIGRQFPHYHWQDNKGYGTADHLKAIKKNGVHDLHRKLYVRNVLASLQTKNFTK
jgi:ribonuclease HII